MEAGAEAPMELTVHDAIGLGDRSPAVVACSLDDTVAKVMRQFVQEHNPAYGNDFVFVHCGNRVGLIDGRDAREDATLRDFGLEVTPSVQVVSGFRWPGEDRGDNVAGATGADGDAGSASTTFKLNVCGGLPAGTYSGSYELVCSLDDTVAKVMQQFAEETQRPADRMNFYFVFCGKKLMGNRTLRDYNVEGVAQVRVMN